MRYLLDTNIISNVIKFPAGQAATRMASFGADELGTSIIVAAELRFGYVRVESRRLEILVEEVLSDLEVLAWDVPADRAYAKLRAELEKQGRVIGQNDMLIAAHALALEATLVTDNEQEFARVPGLKIENWLRQ
jgi:tRNA(fMet)-specific endonuclease VapC